MAAPQVPWKEGRSWTAAVAGAVRLPAIPSGLWTIPAFVALGTGYAWVQDSVLWMVLGGLTLAGTVAALVRLGVLRMGTPEFQEAARLADSYDASRALQLAWANLGRALDRLGWHEDRPVVRKVPTGKLDENKVPILEERRELVREYPEVLLSSEDPSNEVRLTVRTTSGLVASSQAEGKAADLADFLGLNGWVVEVSPASTPGCIEIRIARYARGGDVNRQRVRVEG